MSEHRATVRWQRTSPDFTYESYNRDHDWILAGVQVPASAAPAYRGTPERVDPEEAFVASLSSCHMLTFLALACKKRFTVDSYEDDAVGYLEKNANGKHAETRAELRPRIRFSPPSLFPIVSAPTGCFGWSPSCRFWGGWGIGSGE